MDIIKIIFLGIAGLLTLTLTRRLSAEYALFSSCLLCLSITVLSVSILTPVLDYVKTLTENETYGQFCALMLKCAGVCLLCTFACEICRDCGESALATKLELAGKCTLLAYLLPLIKQVFGYALEILD